MAILSLNDLLSERFEVGRSPEEEQKVQLFLSQVYFLLILCINFKFLIIFPQLQQATTINGPVVESQRTTFVKQLKLGKVSSLFWLSINNPIIYFPFRNAVHGKC